MVLSWLLNSMSKNLLSSVIYLNTAHEVWTDLKSRLSQGNRPRVFELRRMVSNLSQDNLFVSSYYTKFKIVWDELANYKSIPSCSCGVCTCGSMVASAQYQKEECTMNFLMGLNEAFATVRGQILLMEPLPSLNKVFSLVTQEERRRRVGSNPMPLRLLLLFSQKVLMVLTWAITLVSLMPRKIGQFVHTVL